MGASGDLCERCVDARCDGGVRIHISRDAQGEPWMASLEGPDGIPVPIYGFYNTAALFDSNKLTFYYYDNGNGVAPIA